MLSPSQSPDATKGDIPCNREACPTERGDQVQERIGGDSAGRIGHGISLGAEDALRIAIHFRRNPVRFPGWDGRYSRSRFRIAISLSGPAHRHDLSTFNSRSCRTACRGAGFPRAVFAGEGVQEAPAAEKRRHLMATPAKPVIPQLLLGVKAAETVGRSPALDGEAEGYCVLSGNVWPELINRGDGDAADSVGYGAQRSTWMSATVRRARKGPTVLKQEGRRTFRLAYVRMSFLRL